MEDRRDIGDDDSTSAEVDDLCRAALDADVRGRTFGESRNADSGFVQLFDQRLTVNAPDLFVVGATFAAAGTKLGFEIARVDYRMLPVNAFLSPGGYVLQSPAPAIEPRAGVRQVIGLTRSRQLALSAGVWGEGIHALTSNAADPFVPAPQRRTWLTGGVGLEMGTNNVRLRHWDNPARAASLRVRGDSSAIASQSFRSDSIAATLLARRAGT